MKTVKRVKKVNRAKRSRNIFVLCIAVLIFGALITYSVNAAPENRVASDINLERFIDLNSKYYTKIHAIEVPSYETRNNTIKRYVVIVDFNAHVQGGRQHIVTCKDKKKDCNNQKNRKLINLDDRKDKKANYYKRLLNP